MYSHHKKEEAIKLRKEGYAYSYISQKLSIAKSTLSIWLSGVSFIPNDWTKEMISQGQKKSIDYKRVDKARSINNALGYALEKVGNLSERDIFILGIGIYIGEGSKTGNMIRIVNSDPRIIQFAMKWFKTCFGLTNSNFKIRIHMYPDNNAKDVLDFWMKHLKLNKKHFHIPYTDIRLDKKPKKRNVLPFGTAHLSVVSNGDKNLGVLLQRKILASIDHVLK